MPESQLFRAYGAPAKWGVQIAGMIFQTGSRACRLQKAFFKHILERGQKELFEKYMTNFASRIPVCISACLLFPVLRS